jgi:hypothetical protein
MEYDPQKINLATRAREQAIQELLETHAAEFNLVHARIRAAAGLPPQPPMTENRLTPEEIDVLLRRRAA